MKSLVGTGPVNGPTMKPDAGFTGLKALQYSGGHTADGHGYAYNKVYDVDLDVTPESELSYLIFPELTANDLGYPSTYAAVDLAFTDGTYLSELGATDQHGATLSPQGQGASKSLYANQWNRKAANIGAVAAGKTIDRILVAYDNPAGPHLFNGWVDDIRIEGAPETVTHARPSDWVLTTRGTNSTGSFSRGNNIPATAVPHGFNFWTPMTDAGSLSLALRLPAGQQRRQPAGDPGVRGQPRAEPVDGRPPDLPGHAVARRRRAGRRPRRRGRSRSGTRTRSPSRTATASSSRTACGPTSRRPTTPRCSASPSPATRAT